MEAFRNVGFNIASSNWMQESSKLSGAPREYLLGIEDEWAKEMDSKVVSSMAAGLRSKFEDLGLQYLMEEPRYFIVLMAWDLPLAKMGEFKLHWMTRYSIRTTGQYYDNALNQMNMVASNYFGENFENLKKGRASDDAQVIIGEIEVTDEVVEE